MVPKILDNIKLTIKEPYINIPLAVSLYQKENNEYFATLYKWDDEADDPYTIDIININIKGNNIELLESNIKADVLQQETLCWLKLNWNKFQKLVFEALKRGY